MNLLQLKNRLTIIALDTIVIQATLYECKGMDEGGKYRLSCGTGAGTTMTAYSERRSLVTIVEEKLQVKR